MSLPIPVDGAVLIWSAASGGAEAATGVQFDASNQSTPISSTQLAVPTVSGVYLITVELKIVTAALGGHSAPNSTLGPVTLSYTCADTNLPSSVTMGLFNNTGAVTQTLTTNAVNTSINGSTVVCVVAGVPITLTVGYASQGTTTPMAYAAHIKCVFLGAV